MRIQHNIPAMNSYRNYTSNISSVNKSLEKLSSGYRINRAGDDAAGLAISEKMRAQISGLEQAQSNAKSGINLVQTAEGALTEVHDMLNRMYTLAEQSANGTYSDDVDREQLQKEITSLTTEINRIADSANFNGIKLLDGSLDANDKVKVNATTFTGLKENIWDENGTNFGDGNGMDDDSGIQGWGVFTHKEGTTASKTSFEVDLSNLSVSGLGDGGTTQFEFGLASKDKTDWLGTATATTPANHQLDSSADSIDTVGGESESTWQAVITAGVDGTVDGAKIASELVKALGDTNTVNINDVEYKVTAEGSTLKFEMTDDGFKTAAADDTGAKFNGNFNIAVKAQVESTTAGTYDTLAAVSGMTDNSTSNIQTGSVEKGTQLADVVLNYYGPDGGHGDVAITDGSGIKIGDTSYVFAMTDDTLKAQYSSDVKVVDIRDICEEKDDGTWGLTGEDTEMVKNLNTALSRVTVAAADNEMFSVQLSSNGTSLCLREKESYSGDADLTTLKGIQKEVEHFTLANSNVTTTKATGKALTLQIGDTSESFNQMGVNVEDMHASAMGIGDIDISTQQGAADAVAKIKDAVNYVSNTRGTLGALQNRLDHTINNLGVMQENIQDAESTIRDVDVAKEMMSYTKNSILVQSAQAMLAQANQLPQGVLQLLG